MWGGNLSAQTFTKIYDFGIDLKNYHTVVSTNRDEHYMGGTLFTDPSNYDFNLLHHIEYDINGGILNSNTFDVQDHDERCVAMIEYPNAGQLIMVGLLRDNIPATGLERIKILQLNYSGTTIIADYVLESTATSFNQIYPMDAIVNEDNLYVCGFVSNVGYNKFPDFGPVPLQAKKAFVLRFDLINGTTQCNTYDYAISVPNNQDNDIALRMKVVDVGGTNQLFVTGSCNIAGLVQTSPTTIPPTFILKPGAGTMNLVLDLGTLATIYDKPFFEFPDDRLYEYGFDIKQTPSGYFIFGNSGGNYNVSSEGFDPNPTWTWTTYVDNNFDVPITPAEPRNELYNGDYMWGLNTLESKNGTNNALLSGYFTNVSCISPFSPSNDNVNPFLTDISLQYDFINAKNTSFVTDNHIYLSQLGTIPSPNPNSFRRMGGGLSVIAWQAKFATRLPLGSSPSDNIYMYAPTEGFASSTLSLKDIKTDDFGDVPSCQQSIGQCFPDQDTRIIEPCSGSNCFTVVAPYLLSLVGGYESMPGTLSPIADDDCSNSGNFRTVVSQTFNEAGTTTLTLKSYPNPVQSVLHVGFSQHLEANDWVVLKLYDMYGRSVGHLHEGYASVLSASGYNIENVASGLYTLSATVNSKKVSSIKIVKK